MESDNDRIVRPPDGSIVRVAPIERPKRGRPKRVEPWPWEVLGLAKTTYYRLKKQGKLPPMGDAS